jgi:NADPH:quinone reductase-like Zn-dependent oxidoreductase
VSPVVSAVIGLDDVPKAFADLAADRSSNGKILVQPNGALD